MAAPAMVFFTGALLAWAFAGGGMTRLTELTAWLNEQTAFSQLLVALVTLTSVASVTIVVRRATTPVLRLMEGYWPDWLGWFTERCRKRAIQRKEADSNSWQKLQFELDELEKELDLPEMKTEAPDAQVTKLSRLRMDLARLERRRRHRPVLASELLPTKIGNILRSAETRPGHRYGLDAVIVWPRLWLVLPDPVRQELAAARAALDAAVSATIWGLGFIAFTPWAWWAAPLGIAVVTASVAWWIPTRAQTFADLVEAAYDLHRIAVYLQLRWPLPTNPADEQESGIALTQYLDRGSRKDYPLFTPPS